MIEKISERNRSDGERAQFGWRLQLDQAGGALGFIVSELSSKVMGVESVDAERHPTLAC